MTVGASAKKISFEFFPPKNAEQAVALTETAWRLARFRPEYVSVTYGAGGTSQARSLGAVAQMAAMDFATAAHVTCAGASSTSLAGTIAVFRAMGIDRFVALRGDPPGGLSEPYRPHPDGFHDTAEIVCALKDAGAADVSVSAYPEKHPQSADWNADIDALKRKIDAGADRAITQFFFDNDLYDAYVNRVRAAGIQVPVVPGVMPIHRFASICTFAGRCGSSIPDWLARRFEGLEPESDEHQSLAADVVAEQVSDLMRRGVDEFHIYTLNRAELAEVVCQTCGLSDGAGENFSEDRNAAPLRAETDYRMEAKRVAGRR